MGVVGLVPPALDDAACVPTPGAGRVLHWTRLATLAVEAHHGPIELLLEMWIPSPDLRLLQLLVEAGGHRALRLQQLRQACHVLVRAFGVPVAGRPARVALARALRPDSPVAIQVLPCEVLDPCGLAGGRLVLCIPSLAVRGRLLGQGAPFWVGRGRVWVWTERVLVVHADRLYDGRHVVRGHGHERPQADAVHGLILVLRRDFLLPGVGVQGLQAADGEAHRARLGLPDHRVVVHHRVPPAWGVELLCVDLGCGVDSLRLPLERLVIALEHRFVDPVVRLVAAVHPWDSRFEGGCRRALQHGRGLAWLQGHPLAG